MSFGPNYDILMYCDALLYHGTVYMLHNYIKGYTVVLYIKEKIMVLYIVRVYYGNIHHRKGVLWYYAIIRMYYGTTSIITATVLIIIRVYYGTTSSYGCTTLLHYTKFYSTALYII